MSDSERLDGLLAECARGSENALAELYRLTSPHLFAFAARILRRKDWAEEVLQECYLSIWQNAGRFSAEQNHAMAWMTRIVRNRCIDLLRRPALERPDPDGEIVESWADDAAGPLGRLQGAQDSKRLAECMKELEGKQRMAIAMSFFDDLSHGEIAQKLESPLGTIKSWVRRGMERLKRCLS
jgi:RNA polymerase sigma-70 factor (ECF subfamily)